MITGTAEKHEFLTTSEFCAWTRIRPATARQWRSRKYGPPSFKVGNTVLYRRTAVEQWLEAQERAEDSQVLA